MHHAVVVGFAVMTAACGVASSLELDDSGTTADDGGLTLPADASVTSLVLDGGGVCLYPTAADTSADASAAGCSASSPGNICQVSNGATVEADGAVLGGTSTCSPICAAGHYQLTCSTGGNIGAPIPQPTDWLGCEVIPDPTAEGVSLYCCPCVR